MIQKYIDKLLSQSFEGWTNDEIKGYKTGLLSIKEKIKEHQSNEEMYNNMQYYMEYCIMNDYITPHKWIKEHKI